MKKMKKTISFILVVIMLLSVLPMQIFAAGPTLEKIEFIDNTPISNQYIQYVAALNPELGKKQSLYEVGNAYKYYYKLYFSNGRTLNTFEGNYTDEYWACGIKDYNVETYVDATACQKAIDEGRSSVKVTVCVELDKLLGKNETLSFEVEKEIVEGYVKSVKLIGEMPKNLRYSGGIANKLNGRDVEIEYYDGRKEIQKIVCIDAENTSFCHIGDESASLQYFADTIYEDGKEPVYIKGVMIDFLDANTAIVREEVVCPYEKIEFVDYKIEGKGNVTEVTYRLTYKDGKVIEKTCKPDGTKNYYDQLIIDTVDGYDVVVELMVHSTYYYLYIEIGDVWSVRHWINGRDAREVCNCLCHEYGFKYFIGYILVKIWKLFRINEYCDCGYQHY